jgi:hypothetical protein
LPLYPFEVSGPPGVVTQPTHPTSSHIGGVGAAYTSPLDGLVQPFSSVGAFSRPPVASSQPVNTPALPLAGPFPSPASWFAGGAGAWQRHGRLHRRSITPYAAMEQAGSDLERVMQLWRVGTVPHTLPAPLPGYGRGAGTMPLPTDQSILAHSFVQELLHTQATLRATTAASSLLPGPTLPGSQQSIMGAVVPPECSPLDMIPVGSALLVLSRTGVAEAPLPPVLSRSGGEVALNSSAAPVAPLEPLGPSASIGGSIV